jgi:SAM-dependent methyltransferase
MYIFQTAREELHAQIKRHAETITGRVLDVGAGPVARYRELFRYGEYVSVDVIEYTPGQLVGSAEALPVPDSSFDSLVCTQVLGDVYDLRRAFSEFYRVLKPGGCALVTESLFDSLHDEPNDYWRLTGHALRRLAEDAGFAVETLEARGGYRSVDAQLKARYLIARFDLYNRPVGKIAAPFLKLMGRRALWRDRHDKSSAVALFTHGYLLLARKPHV